MADYRPKNVWRSSSKLHEAQLEAILLNLFYGHRPSVVSAGLGLPEKTVRDNFEFFRARFFGDQAFLSALSRSIAALSKAGWRRELRIFRLCRDVAELVEQLSDGGAAEHETACILHCPYSLSHAEAKTRPAHAHEGIIWRRIKSITGTKLPEAAHQDPSSATPEQLTSAFNTGDDRPIRVHVQNEEFRQIASRVMAFQRCKNCASQIWPRLAEPRLIYMTLYLLSGHRTLPKDEALTPVLRGALTALILREFMTTIQTAFGKPLPINVGFDIPSDLSPSIIARAKAGLSTFLIELAFRVKEASRDSEPELAGLCRSVFSGRRKEALLNHKDRLEEAEDWRVSDWTIFT